jgi:hypothetical protein
MQTNAKSAAKRGKMVVFILTVLQISTIKHPTVTTEKYLSSWILLRISNILNAGIYGQLQN